MSRYRSPLTLLVLVLLVVGGAIWGWNALTAGTGSNAATPQDCSTQTLSPGGRLRAHQITVSVFNAGTVQGLATETLDQLHGRGFEKGVAADAQAKVHKVAIWTSTTHDPAVTLVAHQFKGKVKIVKTDSVLGEGIQVIVGNQFPGLAKAKTSIQVKKPAEVCTSD